MEIISQYIAFVNFYWIINKIQIKIVEKNSTWTHLPSDRNNDVSLYTMLHGRRYQVARTRKNSWKTSIDRVPTYVQQLQFTVKNPTVGKAATFTKVDNVIQETKNLMNVISKVVTTCFVCATKVSYRVRPLVDFFYYTSKIQVPIATDYYFSRNISCYSFVFRTILFFVFTPWNFVLFNLSLFRWIVIIGSLKELSEIFLIRTFWWVW